MYALSSKRSVIILFAMSVSMVVLLGNSISGNTQRQTSSPSIRDVRRRHVEAPNDPIRSGVVEHHRTSDTHHTARNTSHRLNVIFIMSDDMRAQLGVYEGQESEFTLPKLHTPNFDKLARSSLLLKKAYVQYTLCGPSRASILTSRRPDTTGVYANGQEWRETGGNFTTIPRYFKENGYFSVGMGKIFHGDVDPASWSVPFIPGKLGDEQRMMSSYKGAAWKSVSVEEQLKYTLPDLNVVRTAKLYLRDLATKTRTEQQPFFLALGFSKPHLPFTCPSEYFDIYPKEENRQFLPRIQWQSPVINYGCGIVNTTFVNKTVEILPDKHLRSFRQAYFACISYVDSLLGDLLRTVDDLGLTDSTIISFVADHGYHLGENGVFGKQHLFNAATHVPMMVRVPGLTDRGIVSDSVTEALDLFPTLAEAAGLPTVPVCPRKSANTELCTQGSSLIPLIDNPVAPVKDVAVSQIHMADRMLYSIMTERYRYTRCTQPDTINQTSVYVLSDTRTNCPEHLYDFHHDPAETENLVLSTDYSAVRQALADTLQQKLYQI